MACIGTTRRTTTRIVQQFGLAPFRDILPSDVFASVARHAGCEPKRDRPLIPEVVAWLMMYVGLQTASMTQGLSQAWGLVRSACPHLPGVSVTEEAFCQARRKLTLGFWRSLWRELSSRFEKKFDVAMRWKGKWRVLALDGTDVDLPNAPAIVGFFGKPGAVGGNARRPQAKLVALCSVFTGFCFGFQLLTQRFTEHHAIVHFVRRLRRDDLVVMDRGFFSLRYDAPNSAAGGRLPPAHARQHGAARSGYSVARR
jgi:hypothetical protein